VFDQDSRLIEEALALTVEERTDLVERLLSSLDPPEPQIEKLWAREVEDRIAAFDRGEIKTVSSKEFFEPPHRSSK